VPERIDKPFYLYTCLMAKMLDGHTEITPGVAGGKPRMAGRRITIQNIAIWHER
jgi:uncharacterized protein (DUF433 family)